MTARKRPAPSRTPPAPKKSKPTAKVAPKLPVKAAVAKPAPKPVAKPAPTKPAPTKPVLTKPAPTKPVLTKPVLAKPVLAKPVLAKPATAKPTPGTKPAAAKPAPVLAKPAPAVVVPKMVPEKIPPRTTLLPKLFKALKAQYKPVVSTTSRPILEQVLLACCLENAPVDAAERAFTRLMDAYFDFNEVRVTTVAELAETLHDLPDPAHAALSLRRALQGVFESTYSFSLEHARKHSLAHGIKVLEGLHGVPQFVIQHVASTGLGGHLIPLDKGALAALWLCGLITRQEYDSGKVPGLERVIGKKTGIEFSSLLHQFGIEVLTNLHGTTVRKIALAANPAAKDRFPKRGEPLPEPVPPPVTVKEGQKAATAALAAEELRPAGPQAAARPAGKTPQPPAGSGPKKPDGKGKSGPKPFVVKPLSIKPQMAPPPEPPPPEPAKKPAAAAKPPAPAKAKHSADLSKRKPR